MSGPQTVTFTTNSTQLISYLRKAREHTQYLSLILAYGTFGGGTLSFYLSPDNGTTLIPLTQSPGATGISLTSNGMAVITLGTPGTNLDQLQLWATLTGGTASNITVKNYDNNN